MAPSQHILLGNLVVTEVWKGTQKKSSVPVLKIGRARGSCHTNTLRPQLDLRLRSSLACDPNQVQNGTKHAKAKTTLVIPCFPPKLTLGAVNEIWHFCFSEPCVKECFLLTLGKGCLWRTLTSALSVENSFSGKLFV